MMRNCQKVCKVMEIGLDVHVADKIFFGVGRWYGKHD